MNLACVGSTCGASLELPESFTLEELEDSLEATDVSSFEDWLLFASEDELTTSPHEARTVNELRIKTNDFFFIYIPFQLDIIRLLNTNLDKFQYLFIFQLIL